MRVGFTSLFAREGIGSIGVSSAMDGRWAAGEDTE